MRQLLGRFLLVLCAALLFAAIGARATTMILARPDRAPRPVAAWAQAFVVESFHRYYYDVSEQTWANSTWLGHPLLKAPTDLFVMQEIIAAVKPDVLIEAGTYKGGSALYFASLMDLLGKGRVVTIDIYVLPGLPTHPRITYLVGSSTSDDIADRVRAQIRPGDTVMVVLDSDHTRDHVLKELQTYGPLVTSGSYLIVEDTNLNGHPVEPNHGPGPMEAVQAYLAATAAFKPDRSREKFLLTFNPGGYLKRQ